MVHLQLLWGIKVLKHGQNIVRQQHCHSNGNCHSEAISWNIARRRETVIVSLYRFVSSRNNFCHLIHNTCLTSFIFMDFDFLLLIAEPLRLKITSDDRKAEYFYFIMKYLYFTVKYPGKNACFPHSVLQTSRVSL